MFPICDEQGRVIGFSGRVLTGDERPPNTSTHPRRPSSPRAKSFALDKSKRAILDAGFAIVCEGQLDSIACFMAGVQNIVAPQGMAFTDQHAHHQALRGRSGAVLRLGQRRPKCRRAFT